MNLLKKNINMIIKLTGVQPRGKNPGPLNEADKKLYKVNPDNDKKQIELSNPASDELGGHHMLEQCMVIPVTHFIIP